MEFVAEIENIKPNKILKREYQINIFHSARNRNSLVVLPTGLGKTIIAIMILAYRAKMGKVLFLAPTKPLCEQHYANIKELTTLDGIFLVTGEKTKKEKRREIYRTAKIIVATPQTIRNDLDIIDFEEFSLVIFDEVHRAVGNYAYVEIAKECLRKDVQTLGLTASPGSNSAKLKEVIENLGIENIEVRTEDDSDVKPYIPERKIKWKIIDMPKEIKEISAKIDEMIVEFLIEMNKYFKLSTSPKKVTKKMLIDLQNSLQKRIGEGRSIYNAISMVSALIKLYHLKEMLTSQGIESAKSYINKIEKDETRAGRKIRAHPLYKIIKSKILQASMKNPKLEITKAIVIQHLRKRADARIIIFAEYRDTIDTLVSSLNEIEGVRATKFIGQARGASNGMSQDEQKKVIQQFRNGTYNVLVSTSIGEEGIDIPATSLVLFYEPVPSAIRHIQRRGRTARGGIAGEVWILIMKGSRDEAYYWSSRRKEKKMLSQIRRLRDMIKTMAKEKRKEITGQTKLDSWL